jgi:hypothetical protein
MTILEENHHSYQIVEDDPMLYEDAGEMVEYLAQALKQTSRETTILPYAPALKPLPVRDGQAGRPGVLHLQRAGRGCAKAGVKTAGAQRTLEAYS